MGVSTMKARYIIMSKQIHDNKHLSLDETDFSFAGTVSVLCLSDSSIIISSRLAQPHDKTMMTSNAVAVFLNRFMLS